MSRSTTQGSPLKRFSPLRPRASVSAAGSASAALLALSALVSCEAENNVLSLYGAIQLDPASCQPSDAVTDDLTMGTLDLALANTYSLSLAVKNDLVNMVMAQGYEDADGRVNTNNVNLTHLEVEYLDPDAVDIGLDPMVTIPLTGFLQTGSDVEPTIIPKINVIDAQMSDILAQNPSFKSNGLSGPVITRGSFTVVLALKLYGRSVNGKQVTSNTVELPVEVCTGCRVSGSCLGAVSEEERAALNLCPSAVGRDEVFASCDLCQELANPSFASLCQP